MGSCPTISFALVPIAVAGTRGCCDRLLWRKIVSEPRRESLEERMAAVLQTKLAADRKAFYDKIDKANVTPLWEVLHNIITPTPSTPCKPHLWKWDHMWPWI